MNGLRIDRVLILPLRCGSAFPILSGHMSCDSHTQPPELPLRGLRETPHAGRRALATDRVIRVGFFDAARGVT